MSEKLYTLEILRLAAATADHPRLAAADFSEQRRAPTCGSTMTVDLAFSPDGRVSAYGHDVKACALGQAAATILARAICGMTVAELVEGRDAFALWLATPDAPRPDWPDIELLAPARAYPARHGAMLLPFEAAVAAASKVAA